MIKHVKNVKFIIAIAALVLLSVGVFGSSAYAATSPYNDNIGFSFVIKAKQGNGHEGDARKRETSRDHDAWKVKMTSSNEPSGKTISTFWLEDSGTRNVSPTVDKTEGAGYSYRAAKSGAGPNVWVWLTAQNNNYNSNTYTVKGYWDEETGLSYPSLEPIDY